MLEVGVFGGVARLEKSRCVFVWLFSEIVSWKASFDLEKLSKTVFFLFLMHLFPRDEELSACHVVSPEKLLPVFREFKIDS